MSKNQMVIGIGAFTANEVESILSKSGGKGVGFHLYDPRPEIQRELHRRFDTIDERYIRIWPEAVSDSFEGATLNIDGDGSSILPMTFSIRYQSAICVDTVTLEKAVERVDRHYDSDTRLFLIMNCEGAELQIVASTDEAILRRFDEIKIEFHPDACSNEEITDCKAKLSSIFKMIESETSIKKHPVAYFVRRSAE